MIDYFDIGNGIGFIGWLLWVIFDFMLCSLYGLVKVIVMCN